MARATGLLPGLVVAVVLVAGASPAQAAGDPPWRFAMVSTNIGLPAGTETEQALRCPLGYRPISGGVAWNAEHPSGEVVFRRYEKLDPPTGQFQIDIANGPYAPGEAKVRITANCVLTSNLGDLRYIFASFPRNSSTRHGGGTVMCPDGYRLLGGEADWDVHGQNLLDYSAPVLDADGIGVGWYASGFNGSSAKLMIGVECLRASFLDREYAEVDLSDAATTDGQNMAATAVCRKGYRILTGGAYVWNHMAPTQDHGFAWASGPSTAQQWAARAHIKKGERLAAVAVCIPASKVSVQLQEKPLPATYGTSAYFAYTVTDEVGETVSVRCRLDGGSEAPCGAGSVSYSGLSDGVHTFTVSASNQSGSSQGVSYSWQVDRTKPELVSWTPIQDASITGSITVTFSEPVRSINSTTVKVLPFHGDAAVPGDITRVSPTVIAWSPREPLIPGELYSMLLDGVQDEARNDLTVTSFGVRTDRVVQNTSPALRETWDPDARTLASDGRVITSSRAGSSAGLSFRATAGQRVAIVGIRQPSGGYADVYLDGTRDKRVSFHRSSADRGQVYLSGPLTAGTHSLSIRPTGTHPAASSGSDVSVDAIAIGGRSRQESGLAQAFARVDLTGASGGSYDTVVHASDADGRPAFKVLVAGTGVDIRAVKDAGSGSARIIIDGTLRDTVDLHADTPVPDALVFSMDLDDGYHTIRIEPVGTAGGGSSAVGIDRIVVR